MKKITLFFILDPLTIFSQYDDFDLYEDSSSSLFAGSLFMILFLWPLFSLLVAAWGDYRVIGSGESFLISLIFSPVIGCIAVAVSKTKKEDLREKEALEILRLLSGRTR